MSELRQEIARKICDVWGYIWDGDPDDAQTAPDKNDGYDTRPSKELFLEAADALLPLISKAEQRGAERMREWAAGVADQRHGQYCEPDPWDYGAQDACTSIAVAICSLPIEEE